MAGKVINDNDKEILEQLGIDPNTMGVSSGEVRIEDSDIFLPLKGLPSGGKLYRNHMNIPITTKGMPFKVEDTIALYAMQDEENHEVIDDVFRKRIKGVPPEELLEMDRKYILAWMRDQTFQKAPLRRTFICSKCGHVNMHRIIELKNFVTYYLPDGVSEPEFDLPESQQRVKLKFERRKDVIRVKEYIKSFEGFRKITPADVKTFRIASLISGKSIEGALEFMAELSVIDFSVLSTQFDRCNMGMTDIAAVECNNEKGECGHINLIPIPFRSEYFIPRIGPDLVDQGESISL
jgi:hypothetical protein